MSEKQASLEKWASLLENKSKRGAAIPTKEDPPPMIESRSPEPDEAVSEQEEPQVLSVSALNQILKRQIEGQFQSIWLQGEISNFKPHTSGHFYFSLKDERSQISAVMFKGFNSRLKFRPENGMEVVVRGRVTVYEPRGSYQIFCESMEPVGAGALQKAFEQLKAKLQEEGLFAPEHKKPLPFLPKKIGVVTSPTGAAIQDILNVLGRRYRGAHVTVIPARVQGDGAAQEVVRGIQLANSLGDFDVLIVGRGGGSIEDLWCFNEEIVARAIFASQIPIISAVGHEIDFTIADFVADYRAPTPSAAAEVVVKSVVELQEKIRSLHLRLIQKLQHKMSLWQQKILFYQSRLVDPKRRLEDLSLRCDEALQRLQMSLQRQINERRMHIRWLREKLKNPRVLLNSRKERVSHLGKALVRELQSSFEDKKSVLHRQMSVLDSLSPLRVLQRGYSVVFKESQLVRDPKSVKAGESLIVQMEKGSLEVRVVTEAPNKIKAQE